MSDVWKSRDGSMELRLGDYREVLGDVECDVLLFDAPYSGRTHEGQRNGSRPRGGGGRKSTITYGSIVEDDAVECARFWSERTRWWAIGFSDHTAQKWWERAWESVGWYVFAPVIWKRSNPTPRLSGDGPTSSCEYITVARPRHRIPSERCGSRPGDYSHGWHGEGHRHPGAKPSGLMSALVRDYSLPGDVIADPFAGSGTTLLSAAENGRRGIGAEVERETFDLAAKRLSAGYTLDMFGGAA